MVITGVASEGRGLGPSSPLKTASFQLCGRCTHIFSQAWFSSLLRTEWIYKLAAYRQGNCICRHDFMFHFFEETVPFWILICSPENSNFCTSLPSPAHPLFAKQHLCGRVEFSLRFQSASRSWWQWASLDLYSSHLYIIPGELLTWITGPFNCFPSLLLYYDYLLLIVDVTGL